VPQKIDDFDASFQGQQAGPEGVRGYADETMPEWAGEIAWRKMVPKGRFYGAHEFCNCLENKEFKNEQIKAINASTRPQEDEKRITLCGKST
jgi:hypothetical protein